MAMSVFKRNPIMDHSIIVLISQSQNLNEINQVHIFIILTEVSIISQQF